MKIFILGAAGFIGTALSKYCLEQGHQVTMFDNNWHDDHPFGGYKTHIHHDTVECDIAKEPGFMNMYFSRIKPDVVYALQAYASEGRSNHIRSFIHQNNTISMANVINACVNHKCKLVFTSSVAVYSGTPPFTEETVPNPIDTYGLSKWTSERDIQIAAATQGLDFTIVRPRNCYDDQTEILTNSGWKKFADLNSWDTVATLNPDTDELEYHLPTDYQKITYNGKMYHFSSKMMDMCVTPDHKMYVDKNYRNDKKKMEFVTADKVVKHDASYFWRQKRDVKWNSGISPYKINLPEMFDKLGRKGGRHQNYKAKSIPAKLWAEFIGWYVSEGSRFNPSSGHYVVCIGQYKRVNPDNYQRIVDLVKEMGFTCYLPKCGREIKIYSRQLFFALEECGLGHSNKQIPHHMMSWSNEYLNILFDSMMKGDGDKDGSRYSTTSQKLCDQMTELVLKLKRSCSVLTEEKNRTKIFRVSIFKDGYYAYPQIGDNTTKRPFVKEVNYNGFVYDVTVPNHIIFVRRNGRSVWSSNCYGPGQNMFDPSRNLFGIWMYNALNKKPCLVYGDGEQKRSFTYIDDLIPFLYKAKDVSNEIINLGSGISYSLNFAKETFKEMTGWKRFEHVAARHEVKEATCDTTKARELLGWPISSAETKLFRGVEKMWEWALEQPMRELDKMPELEVTINAHSSLK